MNTLKPLLTVAVLAGIGYGVYIRLNTGNNGPPPVDPGWNASPAIELPDATGAAPWNPGAGASASVTPGTVTVPGGQAPPYQPPGAASEAPPFAGAPGGQAPPFGGSPSASAGGPPTDMHPSTMPDGPPLPAANPYGDAPPLDGGVEASLPPGPNMPPGDPYADSSAGYSDAPNYGADVPAGSPYDTAPHDTAPPAYGAAPPAQGAPGAAGGAGEFDAAVQAAHHDLEAGQLAAALRQLTPWYGNDQLSPPQQQQLQSLLDQVAGTVVYSTQNLLENPYEVQPGERLEAISERYQVPWQLLAKINGIEDPGALQPGERLKVVRGPFEAVVSINRRELVLHTSDGLYAGRFPIGVGAENPPQEGTFVVSEKSENPVYYGREHTLGAEDPNNPLGERWIGLGRQMAIHGTNDPQAIGRTDLPGWISLREQDVEEVYDILSLGSRVTIQR